MIDLEAIRKRNENSKHTNRGAPACGVCDEQHCAQTEEDIDALIAEVERLKATDEMQRNAIQAYEHGPAILKVIDDALARQEIVPSRIPASTISEIESMLRQRKAAKPEDTD